MDFYDVEDPLLCDLSTIYGAYTTGETVKKCSDMPHIFAKMCFRYLSVYFSL